MADQVEGYMGMEPSMEKGNQVEVGGVIAAKGYSGIFVGKRLVPLLEMGRVSWGNDQNSVGVG